MPVGYWDDSGVWQDSGVWVDSPFGDQTINPNIMSDTDSFYGLTAGTSPVAPVLYRYVAFAMTVLLALTVTWNGIW
jgi:hypothetical protein